jgi:hypothetical protein
MPSSAIITETAKQDIVNKTNQAQAGVDAYNASVSIFHNTFLNNLAVHSNQKFEAHGAKVLTSTYLDSSKDVVSALVMEIPTTLGVFYAPCRLS